MQKSFEITALMINLMWTLSAAAAENISTAIIGLPPVIYEGPSPHHIYDAGERIVLPCRASGSPPPWYHWYQNGVRLKTMNNTDALYYVEDPSLHGLLHLKTLPLTTQGYYQCIASNQHGSSMSNLSFLQQAVFEDLQSRRRIVNVTATAGRHLILLCSHFTSIPPASVAWYSVNYDENGLKPIVERVKLNARVLIDDNGSLVFTRVTKADTSDAIVYECHAYNYVMRRSSTGSRFRIVYLPDMYRTKSSPELIFSSASVTAVSGSDVQLTCLFSGGSNLPKTNWSRSTGTLLITKVSVIDNGQRLLLRRVSRADEDCYICKGRNKFGETQSTVNVTIVVAPQLVRSSLVNRVLTEQSNVSFSCLARGHPTPTVTWYFNSQRIENSRHGSSLWLLQDDNLTISNIQLNDTGTIACNASNAFGYIISSARLVVLPTSATNVPDDYITEDNTATIPYYVPNITNDRTAPRASSTTEIKNDYSTEQYKMNESDLHSQVTLMYDITNDEIVTLHNTVNTSYTESSYFIRYLQISPLMGEKPIWNLQFLSLGVIVSLMFPFGLFILVISLVCHRIRNGKTTYRVDKQEHLRGCHTFNNKKFGNEMKTETTTSSKMNILEATTPDLECYL